MAESLDADFERSEQLRQHWESLKSEMASLDPALPEHTARRNVLSQRMAQITDELANVVSHTRNFLPSPYTDTNPQTSPPSKPNAQSPHHPHPAPPPQYSARRLHVIERTYDSSDDEHDDPYLDIPPHSSGQGSLLDGEVPTVAAEDLDVPDAPDINDFSHHCRTSSAELRRTMMADAATSADTVITVEGKSPTHPSLRAGLGGLGIKLKDKLKDKPCNKNNTEDEREQLTLELSRLGREVRRLKRIPQRSKHDQRKLDDLQVKAAKISEKLGHSPTDETAPSPVEGYVSAPAVSPNAATAGGQCNQPKDETTKAKKGVIFARSSKAEKERRNPTTATAGGTISRDCGLTEEEMILEAGEEFSPLSQTLGSRTATWKRKKGWFVLEAGVASIKALGGKVRAGLGGTGESGGKTPGGKDAGPSPGAGGKAPPFSPNKSRGAKVDGDGGGNVFAEATTRVKQRGEKLGNAAEGSEQMANDAGDMLAAVRALRQRNKGGRFT